MILKNSLKRRFTGFRKEETVTIENYGGPQLGDNIVEIPSFVRTVKKISFGKTHAVLHGVEQIGINMTDVLYVMGENQWGQIGMNPNKT